MAIDKDSDDETVDLWTRFNRTRGTKKVFKSLVDEERQQGRRVEPAPSLTDLDEDANE